VQRRSFGGVLEALAEGRLSMEEVLRSLRADDGFAARMARLNVRATRREPQRLQIRSPAASHAAVTAAAQHRLRAVLPPHIQVGRGRHYRGGLPTDHFGLIAYVPTKKRPEWLSDHDVVRPFIEGRHERHRYQLRVDVKQVPFARKHAELRPGNRAAIRTNAAHGTLSGAVALGNTHAAVLSGHVAGSVGATIFARGANGTLIELGVAGPVRDDETMDAAVVHNIPDTEVPLLTLNPTAVRSVSEIHAPIALFVACSDGVARKAFVDDVSTPVRFAHGAMTGLLGLSPGVTHEGDSGAPIADAAGRVVAFVVGGSDTHTYGIPAMEVVREMLHL
jgi:hypothetical protein